MKYNSFLYNLKKYGIFYGVLKLLKRLGFVKEDYSALYVQRYYRNLPEDKREKELSCWFNNAVGYIPNLKNPSTFDEKLQWCKLHNSTQIKSELADKVRVKDWVKDRIGSEYVIPTLGVFDSFEGIDFSSLPSKFVLKASHGSRMNIIVENKTDLVMKDVKRKLDFWMKYYYGIDGEQEWHYLSIPHRIIAEPFVESCVGVLNDYKVYCFNGEPKYIQFIENRYGEKVQQGFFDLNWTLMPFCNSHFERLSSSIKRPEQLDKMILLSGILSKDFPFVRVDWYLPNDSTLLFGEMTFTPASGAMKWMPPETDLMLGNLIDLSGCINIQE